MVPDGAPRVVEAEVADRLALDPAAGPNRGAGNRRPLAAAALAHTGRVGAGRLGLVHATLPARVAASTAERRPREAVSQTAPSCPVPPAAAANADGACVLGDHLAGDGSAPRPTAVCDDPAMRDDKWQAFLVFSAVLLLVAIGYLIAVIAIFVFDRDRWVFRLLS